MNNFLDKEYHPVIEDYIIQYTDDELGSVEKETFEEVLVHDDDLRELAFSAKEGKKLLSQLRDIRAGNDFLEKLMNRIS